MDLLVLESSNDDPVVRSSVKGITTVSVPNQKTPSGQMTPISHVSTNASIASNSSTISNKTVVAPPADKDEKILYPFRIRHLGRSENYTLFAPSALNRQEWCDAIMQAKTKHAASLYAQNAEPFRLRVMADVAFGCDLQPSGPKTPLIEGTPLWRALREIEEQYKNAGP